MRIPRIFYAYAVSAMLYALVMILLACSGCITAQKCAEMYPPTRDTSEVKTVYIKEAVHDTTLITRTDSAKVVVTIDCDSLGRARITSTNTSSGAVARARVRSERTGGVLKAVFDCVCDSQAIYFAWRTKDTSDFTKQTIKVIQPYPVPAQLTWWESFCIKFGPWAMGILLAWILLKVGWWALKTYTKVQLPFTNFL